MRFGSLHQTVERATFILTFNVWLTPDFTRQPSCLTLSFHGNSYGFIP
jgi:hypothetical protein